MEITIYSKIIQIPLDKNKIVTFIKSKSGNRFIYSGINLLHSIALKLFDFHKSIQDSHYAKEYARDYL